jgi:cell division protein FtsB
MQDVPRSRPAPEKERDETLRYWHLPRKGITLEETPGNPEGIVCFYEDVAPLEAQMEHERNRANDLQAHVTDLMLKRSDLNHYIAARVRELESEVPHARIDGTDSCLCCGQARQFVIWWRGKHTGIGVCGDCRDFIQSRWELEEKIEAGKKINVALLNEQQRLEARIRGLEAELDLCRRAYPARDGIMAAELDQLKTENERLKAEIQALKNQTTGIAFLCLDAERTALKNRVRELETELKSCQDSRDVMADTITYYRD